MIVDELAARFSFVVEGMEKIRRAIAILAKLQKAILAVAAAISRRLGRVGAILARTTAAAVGFGTAFVASTALITAGAAAATAALAAMAAGFARLRQQTIDSAFLSGVPVQQLDLIEKLMRRIGATAKDGRSFVSEFAQKVREGVKEGGDWAEALAKQGVKLKDAKGKAKTYSLVIDDILKAADKIKDGDKRRDFLKEGLEGAPDELIAQLLQASSALKKWQELVSDARKAGGAMPLGDILNAQDITTALGRMGTALKGFTDAFGSGLMASFAQNFRELGEAVMRFATDDNRERLRTFATTISEFGKDVVKGGIAVLKEVAEGVSAIVDAVSRMNDATGGRLGQVSKGLFLLGGAALLLAAGPLTTISAAITGLLWAISKFQEWKAGGVNALSDFFDAIASSADGAKQAIVGLIDYVTSLPSLRGIASGLLPEQPSDSAKISGRKTGEMIKGLIQKQNGEGTVAERLGEMIRQINSRQGEVSSGSAIQKIESDRATTDNRQNFGNDQRNMPVSISISGVEQSNIPGAIMSGVNQAISAIKATNASTVPGGAQ